MMAVRFWRAHGLTLSNKTVAFRSASTTSKLPLVSAQPLPVWATVNPYTAGITEEAGQGANLVSGKWTTTRRSEEIVDPLTGAPMFHVPATSRGEAMDFASNMLAVPRSGLHNPLKNPERYNMLGDVSAAAAREFHKPEVANFFTALIQRVVGKSAPQCEGEVNVLLKFMENFSADNVRQLARGFSIAGDHAGQQTCGYRFPFGGVSLITPFNFPLEIPAVQMLSALYMGNRPLVKIDTKVQVVCEQFVRMLIHVGLPAEDLDFLYSDGPVANDVIVRGQSRMCLFTGSQAVAEKLVQDLKGRIKLEDAGFDWKILGPDVPPHGSKNYDFAVWQADQDAYGFSGQKCSAQSILFVHTNWVERGFVEHLREKAIARNLPKMSIGPVLSWTNKDLLKQVDACLASHPDAKILWGGKALENHSIPEKYGSFEPTAISFPIEALADPNIFAVATREVFAPFQIIIEYGDGPNDNIDVVLGHLNRLENHLTAGIVSNDPQFLQHVLSNTINGTTYAGWRARTTGAPQQMWFGPSGDPRGAGIHTKEAIQLVWSCHREIFTDTAIVPDSWKPVQS